MSGVRCIIWLCPKQIHTRNLHQRNQQTFTKLSSSLQNYLDISESSNIFENDLNKIKILRLEHFSSLIVGHLNINSLRSKFETNVETTTNFHIFLIPESKINSTFPNMQFKINGYKLFRRDPIRFGGGLMLYLNEEISNNFQTTIL